MAYDTAEQRWAGMGPYYAMFPRPFADWVVERFTVPGDSILDPFAGRGTAIFSASTKNRHAVGVEINPVGWVYGKTKLSPAPRLSIEARIKEIAKDAGDYAKESKALPEFFRYCFAPDVSQFLLAARDRLDWRRDKVDRTIMSFLLVYLHGKRNESLSNQMRQTKAMSPQYSIKWWRCHIPKPPAISPVDFLKHRIAWRYKEGIPHTCRSRMYLGPAEKILPNLESGYLNAGAKLLFTSPPYCGITNYHYDQWLRLWLLGFPPFAFSPIDRVKGRFGNKVFYKSFLANVFAKCSSLMRPDGIIYVRTDSREYTLQTTKDVLETVFPNKRLTVVNRPLKGPTQTRLFGDHAVRAGEVDLILRPY